MNRRQDDILELVRDFEDTLCSDPHDKIYALLSLENTLSSKKPIPVDYSQSMPELVISVVELRYIYDKDEDQCLGPLQEPTGNRQSTRSMIESIDLTQVQYEEMVQLVQLPRQRVSGVYQVRWGRIGEDIASQMERRAGVGDARALSTLSRS